jgi:hypothetical protein
MKIINTQRHRTNLCRKGNGEYSQIYFKGLFLGLQIEARAAAKLWKTKQYNSVENPHQIKGRLKSKIRKILITYGKHWHFYAIDIRLLQTKTWLLNVQLRVRGLRLEQKRLRITESELTLGESLLCVGNWFKDKSQKQQQESNM